MDRGYLTGKEIEALNLMKKHDSQRDVAKETESSAANVSLTLKRAREKIVKAKLTIEHAEEKNYLDLLGISFASDTGRILNVMLNSDQKAVCVVNRNHEIVMTNQAMEKLFGKGISNFVGKKCYEIFVGEKCSKSECPANITFKTGQPASALRTFSRNNGSEIELSITAVPVKNRRGKVAFAVEYMVPT